MRSPWKHDEELLNVLGGMRRVLPEAAPVRGKSDEGSQRTQGLGFGGVAAKLKGSPPAQRFCRPRRSRDEPYRAPQASYREVRRVEEASGCLSACSPGDGVRRSGDAGVAPAEPGHA